MIDQIRIQNSETTDGRKFEQVRIWICGIPFQADSSEYVEKIIRRFAAELEMAVIDARSAPSAAPEMLEALKAAYALIDDVIAGDDPDMAIAKMVDVVGDAIAKAEGLAS